MSYYINPIWFYLVSVSESLKFLFTAIAIVGAVMGLGIYVCYTIDMDEEEATEDVESMRRRGKRIILCAMVSVILAIFIPSEKVCIEMLIASQVTRENAEVTVNEVKEVVDYVIDKINDKEKD